MSYFYTIPTIFFLYKIAFALQRSSLIGHLHCAYYKILLTLYNS